MGKWVFKKIGWWCVHLLVSVLVLYFIISPVVTGIFKVLDK